MLELDPHVAEGLPAIEYKRLLDAKAIRTEGPAAIKDLEYLALNDTTITEVSELAVGPPGEDTIVVRSGLRASVSRPSAKRKSNAMQVATLLQLCDAPPQAPVVEVEQTIVVQSTLRHTREVPFLYGDAVEGCAIRVERFFDAGHDYIRWVVTCPLWKSSHYEEGQIKCEKNRTAHRRQMSHYGVAELYGYLGVWVRAMRDCPDRRSQKIVYKPKLAQIRDYIVERGWPLAGAPE